MAIPKAWFLDLILANGLVCQQQVYRSSCHGLTLFVQAALFAIDQLFDEGMRRVPVFVSL